MAYKPPPYKKHLRRRFRKFVRKWVRKNLQPLDPNEDFDFEKWLEGTNYSEERKVEIRRAKENIQYDIDDKDAYGDNAYATVKYFVKEEFYPEPKHHRGIWARCDEFKCISGPFFKKIEEQLFKLPYFIKKVPKDQRPDYIRKLVENAAMIYQITDFTSYESQFTTALMDDSEFELYRWMSSQNTKAARICKVIFGVVAGFNHVKTKHYTLGVNAKRMSGEMNTSLGNGFTNLMILLFAAEEYNIQVTGPVVEGDDGLMGLTKAIPEQYFVDMGLNVKMSTVPDISMASFCGLIFDPVELINIRDPRAPLCTTMWVTKKYTSCSQKTLRSLVRSKALSLIFEYPGCPILSVLGHKIFSLLEGYELRNIGESSYMRTDFAVHLERFKNNELPMKEIGQRTRALMESMFDITISRQLLIEKDIMEMTLDNWNTEAVELIMPQQWIDNYYTYTMKLTETPSKLPYMFTCYNKNPFIDDLHKVRIVANARSCIKNMMKYKRFIKHEKFVNTTEQYKLECYDYYIKSFNDAQYRLLQNSRLIDFRLM